MKVIALANALKANKEYRDWKAEMELEQKKRLEKLREVNSKITEDIILEFNYREAKVFLEELELSYVERKKFEPILRKLKIKEYPILKKAHYYPILNELDFLTDEEKNKLDVFLCDCFGENIGFNSVAWLNIGISRDKKDKVIKFLLDNGIFEKGYKVTCDCGEEWMIVDSDEYKKYKRYFELENGFEELREREEYSALREELYCFVDCFHCNGREIVSLKDIENGVVVYKNVVKPDTTYENI